jgi:ABC-type Zn uptake system ZnuABC Zn-binding protein ZnuA
MNRGNCRLLRPLLWVALVVVLVSGCGVSGAADQPLGPPGSDGSEGSSALAAVVLDDDARLRVVATTSLVADVVQNVGGDRIDLRQLMPLGADPHAFEPTPQDVAAIGDAHIVFINGVGLEAFMDRLLASAGENTPVVAVSEGIPLLDYEGDHEEDDHEDDDHDHEGDDPHVWFDPSNVMVWVANIEAALSALDPDGAAIYRAGAEGYLVELDALDVWIRAQVASVPEARRKLVTDHSVFAYFAAAYGFEQVGVVTAGSSTLSAPSARELASLQDTIQSQGVPAIFVGTTVDPRLAEQIAGDTGIKVVSVYTGSLSEPGGPADTYLGFMRYDVSQIVGALRGDEG